MNITVVDTIKRARRVSTPIVALQTPDAFASVDYIAHHVGNDEAPKVRWDIVSGLRPLNDVGERWITKAKQDIGEGDDLTVGNYTEALIWARKLPDGAMLFVMMADKWLAENTFVQALSNIRDEFKVNQRMIVMLAPSFLLPSEVAGDTLLIDEPLPDRDAIRAIVSSVHDAAEITAERSDLDRAVEALQGLPAFAVEQCAAMSLTPKGLDGDELWERKRQQIEGTPGLKVYRDGVTFDDVGGVANIKTFMQRIIDGNPDTRPCAVVFIDEIEKMIAGSGGDTSGVSADQLGTILSYMEDEGAVGCIFVGHPGSAKSMVAKATGNTAGIPTIALDLGAAKGSLVGQSEQQLREALKVITSVSSGKSIWIATCNSIASLPPELRRRFTLGTFFFDLPDADERDVIWSIYGKKYDLDVSTRPDDTDWTGAEIRSACDVAHRLGIPVVDAANYIVPVARSAREAVDRLRAMASGRFIDASREGVYHAPSEESAPVEKKKRRRVATTS